MSKIQQQGATAGAAVSAVNTGRGAVSKAALLALAAGSLLALPGVRADAPTPALSQQPVVYQLAPDQFRIAFGIDGQGSAAADSSGSIRYRVDWQTEDGSLRSDTRSVRYTLPRGAARTIAVDYPSFDSPGHARAEVVGVSVERIQRDE